MLFYKNNTPWTKTVNGITFKPGEVKESDRYINVYGFIRVNEPEKPKEFEEKPTEVEVEVETADKVISTTTVSKKRRYKKPTSTTNNKNKKQIKEEMSNG